MTATSWQLSGQYYETCSCDSVCPCVLSQMSATPTKGTCTVVMGFNIERGKYESESLDGLGFIVLVLTPEVMNKGNWSVGLVIDDRATAAQRDAITAIASGAAGGPMAGITGLVGKFLGVESAPIKFDDRNGSFSVSAGKLVDMAAQPAMGLDPSNTEPLKVFNTGHPASSNISLAHATRSHVDALGLSWNDTTGKNHGQYAPFNWRSA